jgi:N-methylhydantoinase A/oxoprolinase/acetone carboxylase beta subunit
MIDAISLNSVQKGYDPRDFALVAAGGGGPVFAWRIAEQMSIPRVIVPRHPGIASAIGLLTTDMRYEFTATVWQLASSMDGDKIEAAYRRLTALALERLREDGLSSERIGASRTADCRYVGQGYELRVPVPDGPIDVGWLSEVVECFQAAHERTYFTRFEGTDIQIINVNVTGLGHVPHAEIQRVRQGGVDATRALKFERPVLFAGNGRNPVSMNTRFYERELLEARNRIQGPAIIEQFDSTTVVGPAQRAVVDEVGHLIIEGADR